MGDLIQVRNVSFKYSPDAEFAVESLDFEVKKGEILAVIGENDAGKSTLCQILVGLIPHYISGEISGDVYLEDKRLADMTMGELSQRVGLVFQNPFNQLTYTTDTVREELAFGLGNLGVPRKDMLVRVERMAALMRISDILDRNPGQLSGGQVQRVALGSSLIMKPEMVVLDECCSQLDPLGSEEIFSVIYDLKQQGMTIVIADHDMERVARIADRILVLQNGHQRAIGTSVEIFTDRKLRDCIQVPDYTMMGECMADKGISVKGPLLTEDDTVTLIQTYKESSL